MREQKRKKIVVMRCLRGWGKWVTLKLQRVVSNIYHGYKGLIPRDDKVQKDHTPLRGCWGSLVRTAASLGAGGTWSASCWWRGKTDSHQEILTLDMKSKVLGLEGSLSIDTASRSGREKDIHRLAEDWRCIGQAKQVTGRIVGSNPS